MAALAVVSVIVALRVVVPQMIRRFNKVRRNQLAWQRWLIVAGPSVSGMVTDWNISTELMAYSSPEYSEYRAIYRGHDAMRIRGSTHQAGVAYSFVTGHPLGIPLSLGLIGAKLVANLAFKGIAVAQEKKDQMAEQRIEQKEAELASMSVEELRRLKIAKASETLDLLVTKASATRTLDRSSAKKRLKAMLDGYDAVPPRRIARFLPSGRLWSSDKERTLEFLEAVNAYIPPRYSGSPTHPLPQGLTVS